MHKELTDTLAVVVTTNRFSEQGAHVQDNQLVDTLALFLRDREGIGNHNSVNFLALLHLAQAVAAKEAVGGHADDLCGATSLDHCLGCGDPGAGLVDYVVDDEDGAVAHVADECDCGFEFWVLEGFFLFVVGGCGVAGAAEAEVRAAGRGGGHERVQHVVGDFFVVGSGTL
jgi:hypothetical protein